MAISASDVKALREKTGAGMMKCKEALNECNGDIEAAVDYLRKKGLAAAAKKQSRVAAEGSVSTQVEGSTGVILEVNCETDFVSKGDDFQNFVKDTTSWVIKNNPADIEALKNERAEVVNELTIKCGEKIDLRRFELVVTNGALGSYNHGGKIGVLVDLETSEPSNLDVQELAKDLAMHVAAAAPTFLTADDIDESFKKREADIYTDQLKAEGKPEKMIPNIVQGKLKKLASEVCLYNQKWVKDPDTTIEKLIKQVSEKLGHEIKVNRFFKLNLGEGIEKREDNLADEVAKMTGKQ
jgi:elongation factor Ts